MNFSFATQDDSYKWRPLVLIGGRHL